MLRDHPLDLALRFGKFRGALFQLSLQAGTDDSKRLFLLVVLGKLFLDVFPDVLELLLQLLAFRGLPPEVVRPSHQLSRLRLQFRVQPVTRGVQRRLHALSLVGLFLGRLLRLGKLAGDCLQACLQFIARLAQPVFRTLPSGDVVLELPHRCRQLLHLLCRTCFRLAARLFQLSR